MVLYVTVMLLRFKECIFDAPGGIKQHAWIVPPFLTLQLPAYQSCFPHERIQMFIFAYLCGWKCCMPRIGVERYQDWLIFLIVLSYIWVFYFYSFYSFLLDISLACIWLLFCYNAKTLINISPVRNHCICYLMHYIYLCHFNLKISIRCNIYALHTV